MSKVILISLLTLHFTLFPKMAEAHLVGQPPFLKINGAYANLYPVPLTSLNNFDLPQDLAPDNYLINQSISFVLDQTRLPAPPEVIAKTKFDWDFNDGIHAQGLTTRHQFTNIGSYIVKVYADDGTTPKPQLIESVLINILPDKSYQLPQAIITVNGKQSKDLLTDILQFSFKNQLNFDGSKSSSQNSIVEYFWDFGDQKSSSGSTQTHSYPSDLSQTFVVLRVKDQNGFLADQFVEIQNSLNEQNSLTNSSIPPTPPKKSNQLPLTLAGLAVLGVINIMARWFVLGHYRGKPQ